MMLFFKENYSEIIAKSMEHLSLSMTALVMGVLVAVPLGIIISRYKKLSNIFIGVTSVLQTIPSLALLAMMVPIFGIGTIPAILALFIYSLLPILRNTVLGMNSVDVNTIDAAKGMGMRISQIVFKIKIPLSMEIIMTGIRLSTIYVLAWGSLASYIGAGGLGDFIFAGLNNFNLPMIVAGTLPITIMALVLDFVLGRVEYKLLPKGGI